MIRGVAFGLSLALHAALIFPFLDVGAKGEASQPPKRATVTRLRFAAPTAKPVPPKPTPIPPVPNRRAKRKVPLPTTTPTPEPMVEEEAAPSEQKEAVAGSHGVAERVDEREEYIAVVLAAIEKNKYYPKSARRRGVEGEVAVRFSVSPDGGVSDLRTDGAVPAFNRAARRAVEKAIPFPSPPAGALTDSTIAYRMEFALK